MPGVALLEAAPGGPDHRTVTAGSGKGRGEL